MFLMPSISHFLECRIYHYKQRLLQVKTKDEEIFIKKQLRDYELQLQEILN